MIQPTKGRHLFSLGGVWPLVLALVLTQATLISAVRAQDAPTAADREAAADAYDQGTAAYMAERFEQAARLFEIAHQRVPNENALKLAVRAHSRSGNLQRAGTLALRLRAEYPEAGTVAGPAIQAAVPEFLLIRVRCTDCRPLLDGALVGHHEFFVAPDEDHRVGAAFETGETDETIRGAAGESLDVRLSAPPAPIAEPADELEGEAGSSPDGEPSSARTDSGGLSPTFTYIAGGLTLALAGLTIWSGLDTVADVEPYEAMPTQEALDAGLAKELRTNILLGATIAAALVTGTLALFFTDWEGDDEGEQAGTARTLRLGGAVFPEGGLITLQGAM